MTTYHKVAAGEPPLTSPQTTLHNPDVARYVQAGILLAILVIAIRVATYFQATWLLLPALFVATAWIAWVTPPLAALFLLFGTELMGLVNIQGVALIGRIPVISTVTVWVILWLFARRYLSSTIVRRGPTPWWIIRLAIRPLHVKRRLVWDARLLARMSLPLLLFLALGFAQSLFAGYLRNANIQIYVLDIMRSWLGYLLAAFLACSSPDDVKVMLVAWPFMFLLDPLTMPLSTWTQFLGVGLSSGSLFIGVGSGALNTNTLGQASSIAAVIALFILVYSRNRKVRLWMLSLFFIATVISFMTAARQSILSIFIGAASIGLLRGSLRGIVVTLVLGLFAVAGFFVLAFTLPNGSGIQTRLLELTQPISEWQSGSTTVREADYQSAIDRWLDAPVTGVGFGGQSVDELSDELSNGQPITSDVAFLIRGTHSLFLGILVQTGVVGFVLLTTFVVAVVWRFLRTLRKRVTSGTDQILLRTVVFAILILIVLQQNISGGLGVSSAPLIFLMGALLGATPKLPLTWVESTDPIPEPAM
jgi:O-antigen ligase